MNQPIILISNDDGYFAEGLEVLRQALAPLGRVISVTPDQDNSGVSHKISIHTPLRLRQIAPDTWVVNGTPVDCVVLGVHVVLRDQAPDLLVSGINRGYNLGGDTTYSGTISAAWEGFSRGIPSMAISVGSEKDEYNFLQAGKAIARLASIHLAGNDFLQKALWNINVPSDQTLKGFRLTRLDQRNFRSSIVKRIDPRGRAYYWIDGSYPDQPQSEQTDFGACKAGYVSLTPLEARRTCREVLTAYQSGTFLEELEL